MIDVRPPLPKKTIYKSVRRWIKEWLGTLKRDIRFYGIRYALTPRWLRNLIYNVKCYFSPYNVIKISTLPRTWTDRDEVLLHVNFQILVDFVNKELHGFGRQHMFDIIQEEKMLNEQYPNPSEEDKHHIKETLDCYREKNNEHLELAKLYKWWTEERLNRKDPLDAWKGDYNVYFFSVASTDEDGDPESYTLNKNEDNKEKLEEFNKLAEKSHQFEIDCRKEDDEMLKRLLALRAILWT